MKNLKGSISISRINSNTEADYIGITIKDQNSRISFLDLKMSYENLAKVLIGSYEVDCTLEVRDLLKVGKKKITKDIIAEMPEGVSWEKRSIVAHDQCLKELEAGWEVSTYFGSKDSFFEKDGVRYCKGNAYTYVEESL